MSEIITKPSEVVSTVEVNQELQASLNNFMRLLKEDIHKFLGKDIPFLAKIDLQIGVEAKDNAKIQGYLPIAQKLMGSVPNTDITK